MKLGQIIFSRFDSNRLPGKALIDIGDKPLLGHVIERAKKVSKENLIVVATSDMETDDPIAEYAQNQNIALFRGSTNNVLLRAFECAEYYGINIFSRICGDRPFFDYELIERFFDIQQKTNADLVTNCQIKSCPGGLATEVVTTTSISRIINLVHNESDKEHMTQFFYNNAEQFNIVNVNQMFEDYSNLNISVDNFDDLERARWIYKNLDKTANGNTEYILKLAEKWNEVNLENK